MEYPMHLYRRSATLACSLILVASTGCDSDSSGSKDHHGPTAIQRDQISSLDRWAVKAPLDSAVEAGVIRQSTLFEYHFVQGKSHLTQVGSRDLSILARHFRGGVWVLSVRQGDAGSDLYTARVKYVNDMLEPMGVDLANLTIVDASPGGDGLASVDARRIREESIKGAGSLSQVNEADSVTRTLNTPLEGDS
jgi:hypothetical protein